jgi:hypothetical protein
MHYAKCGFANPEGVKFCIGCGVPLQHRCPSCGVENLPQARFCGECGTPFTAEQEAKGKRRKAQKQPKGQSLKSKGERRQTPASSLWPVPDAGLRTPDCGLRTLDPSVTPPSIWSSIFWLKGQRWRPGGRPRGSAGSSLPSSPTRPALPPLPTASTLKKSAPSSTLLSKS